MPIIAWTGNKSFDKAINSLKSRCFIVITKIIKYYKTNMKTEETKDINSITEYIKQYTDLTFEGFKCLEFIIREKLYNFTNLEEDDDSLNLSDNGYTTLVYYLLSFLLTVFKQEPIIQTFNNNTIRL